MTIDEKGRAAAIEALEPRCRAITGGANPLARRLAEELADVVLEAYESAKQKEAEEWRELMQELADDLEVEIIARYPPGTHKYPSMVEKARL